MYEETTLQQQIAAGEDTLLEFKEVIFLGEKERKVRFAGEEGKTTSVIAEVYMDARGQGFLSEAHECVQVSGLEPEPKTEEVGG